MSTGDVLPREKSDRAEGTFGMGNEFNDKIAACRIEIQRVTEKITHLTTAQAQQIIDVASQSLR